MRPVRPTTHALVALRAASDLAASGLLPAHLAAAVRRGRMTLQVALARAAWEAEVAALTRRHGLDRALANQVLLGEADLERLLARRACAAYLAERAPPTIFQLALRDGRPRMLHLGLARTLEARIQADHAYDVSVETLDGEAHTLRKLAIRAVTDGPGGRRLQRERVRGTVLDEAPARPQDRYPLSDRRLFRARTSGVAVLVTWLDGERLRGTVSDFNRFDVVVRTRSLGEVTVLRHAIADFGDEP